MKLPHHIGGLEGLDDQRISFEKRVFVEDWETRIFGIHVALMALRSDEWTWGDLRQSAEAMNPLAYFQYRYYEKWLGGITAHLLDRGYFTPKELSAATARFDDDTSATLPERAEPAIDEQVIRYLRQGSSPRRGPATPAYALGDTVTVADPPAADHTRLPGYLRGHQGTVERIFEGNYAYFFSTGPDGIGDPQAVYLVRFEPREIWGERAEANAGPLYAELYEAYLTAGKGTSK